MRRRGWAASPRWLLCRCCHATILRQGKAPLRSLLHRSSIRRRSALILLFPVIGAGACAAQDPILPTPPPPACIMPTGPLPDAQVTVTVSPQARHQMIDGFGTTTRLFDDPHLTNTSDPSTQRSAVIIPATEQAKMLSALYTELGLTRIRYATDPGVEPQNDNADPANTDLSRFDFRWKRLDGHVEYVQAARNLGVTAWFGSPILLESWMSHNDPAEYVEWAMAIIRRWRDLGAPLSYWSIANEPGYAINLSPAFIRDAVKQIGAKLVAEGISTRLVIPDDADPVAALARAQAVLDDPVARQYVAAIAFHLYTGSGTPSQPNTTSLQPLAALAQQYGKPLWMTEWFNPDWLVWARTIHSMLSDYDVSAVDYLWGFFGEWERNSAALMTITYTGNVYTGFVKNKQYWTMGHWSRFVPPGSVRIDATSSDPAILASAYLTGTKIVVVALNTGAAEKTIQVALGTGSPCVQVVTSERTSGFETARILDPLALTGPGFTTALPATSVSTFLLTP